ncbi:MAG: GGDEF domain-containing protein, partial [Firmicutes bacterium]|nr:GGDEF domain-containing protein [Bacillota bacterium]
TEEATTDKLTGFLNKASATRTLMQICREKTGVLLVIDLDNFKLVNDICGHETGDKVLTAFAELARGNLRANDTAGRIGGDEFVAFCADVTDEKTIAAAIRHINEHLLEKAKAIIGEDMTIPLGVSAGAVFVPQQGTDYDTLFAMADKALYFVKQNEKHGYAVYAGGYDVSAKTEESVDETFRHIGMLLEERNIGDSAFWLGQDAFSNVYRFMMRYIQSYRCTAYKALFTLTPPDDINSAEFSAICEQFGHIVNRSLRKSDVMMQYKTNRFFLLFPQITEQYIGKVIERIFAQWKKTDHSHRIKPEYKIESICAEELEERDRRRPNQN